MHLQSAACCHSLLSPAYDAGSFSPIIPSHRRHWHSHDRRWFSSGESRRPTMIPSTLANAKERYESEQQLAALQREVRTRYAAADFGAADADAVAASDPEAAAAAERAAEDAATTFGGIVIHSSTAAAAAAADDAAGGAGGAGKEGNGKLALTEVAKEATAMARRVLGADHPVVASCLNDLAVVLKAQGELAQAIEALTDALGVYAATVGEEHPSFATAQHNLGLAYRALAESGGAIGGGGGGGGGPSSLERQILLDRAAEQLEGALKARCEAHGLRHRDIATTMVSLAGVHRAMGLNRHGNATAAVAAEAEAAAKAVKAKEAVADVAAAAAAAEKKKKKKRRRALPGISATPLLNAATLLQEALEMHRELDREKNAAAAPPSSWTATALNNLAFHHKTVGAFDAAQPLYLEALAARTEALGDAHPDTVAAKHNLAELLIAAGEPEAAAVLQAEILKTLGHSE